MWNNLYFELLEIMKSVKIKRTNLIIPIAVLKEESTSVDVISLYLAFIIRNLIRN